jgi:2-iminoacetate synthase
MEDFINDGIIQDMLDRSKNPSPSRVREIIAHAGELGGLKPEEAAVLLQVEDPALGGEICEAAHDIKNAIYGNRLVMFAPLYTSNYCSNNCLYCGFRRDNRELKRVALTKEEIAEEVKILERQGHKPVSYTHLTLPTN